MPEEWFLGFSECVTGVTGEAIAERILEQLKKAQLPGKHICGQAYDGAGVMAGKKKGVAARIKQQYPKAVYVHCYAHTLNLCIVKSCSIPDIRSTMHMGDNISRFFSNSPKRQLALERWVQQILEGERCIHLKSQCTTRWVEHHEAFEIFIDLFEPILRCLEEMKDSRHEWTRDSISDAHSLYNSLSRFPFILSLVITKDLLAFCKGISVKLQSRSIDFVKAHNEVEEVLATLKEMRDDVDNFHDRMYSEALQLAAKVQCTESVPRTTSRQSHRTNIPASTPSEYYKRGQTIPLLDFLISELETRFTSEAVILVQQIVSLVPAAMVGRDEVITSSDISDLLQLYGNDISAPASLDSELRAWRLKWQRQRSDHTVKSLDSPVKVLSIIDQDFFLNIKVLFKVACTLPITSVECERSTSRLRCLKTYLRSSMSEKRLNGLAMMYVHRNIPCLPDEVISEFSREHPPVAWACEPSDCIFYTWHLHGTIHNLIMFKLCFVSCPYL